MTSPWVGNGLAGGWGIFWNELLEGARPGPARRVAAGATSVARCLTARTAVSHWFDSTYGT